MNFQPQRVGCKSAFYWFREGLALSIRQWWVFIILTFVLGGIDYLPLPMPQLILFLIPMSLGAGCIVAECADLGTNSAAALRSKSRKVWLNLAYVGILPWMPIILVGLVMSGLGLEGGGFSPGEPPLTIFYGGTGLLAIGFFWLVTVGYWFWFAVPLVAVAELPLSISMEQAFEALALNKVVILLVVIFSFSCLIGMAMPVLVFPWVALLASMMYTSYRHIWFDRGLNHPVKNISLQLAESH